MVAVVAKKSKTRTAAQKSEPEQLLTTSEVAARIGCARFTVLRYLRRHPEIGFANSHGYRFVRESEVESVSRLMRG